MLHFQMQFKEDIVNIVLENNYRSTQPILDASTQVINQNQERLINKIPGLSKNLIASLPANQAINIAPSILQYNDPQEEMMDIAEQISVLIAAGTAPKEIAVLYKEHKYGTEIAHF
jgi:DNA helicase-2/ATP-dependent DNA helicase PcrA